MNSIHRNRTPQRRTLPALPQSRQRQLLKTAGAAVLLLAAGAGNKSRTPKPERYDVYPDPATVLSDVQSNFSAFLNSHLTGTEAAIQGVVLHVDAVFENTNAALQAQRQVILNHSTSTRAPIISARATGWPKRWPGSIFW